MKNHPAKKPLTFGELVAGAYRACGARKAKGMIHLALKARLIEYLGPPRQVWLLEIPPRD